MENPDPEQSLGDGATFAGRARPQRSDVSFGDERTLGDGLSGQDTIIDDIEVVDLDARYAFEATLGQGGMGAVMLATDTRLGRKVAIKRILGEAAANRMAVQRFLTEAKAIAALNHPNVVQIYDYGRAADGPFLIMEFVDGGSLLDRCQAGALPLEEVVDLACQLCDGLAKAHDLGIIHRDIKPANVLLTKDGIPKLTDFGLAKAQAGDHGQTMTGAVLGTPDFMPPEQRRDAGLVDHRSDLWSLAATIYQMVTGRSPKIIRFKDVPESIQDVLGKALEDDKEARHQSAREFRDALKASLQAASGGVRPSSSGTAPPSAERQEGQCSACDAVNADLSRKFCRKCGGPLRIACLQCDTQMPVWDTICGECGGNQPQLLAAMRAALDQKRAAAEQRLGALAFADAIALAEDIAASIAPQVADLAEWGRSFARTAAEERDRQLAAATDKLREATAHATAGDYPSAIHALETIPEPLRHGEASRLLAECRSRHGYSTQLIEAIAARVKRKDIEGLLPIVERAVELRGDRADLAKIRQQLTARRDARLARAKAAFAAGDARAAAAALAGAVAEDFGDSKDLLEQVRAAARLEEQLAAVVKDAKADGVVNEQEAAAIHGLGLQYLMLSPFNEKVRALVQQCERMVPPKTAREQVNRLVKQRSGEEWLACPLCQTKVKAKNLVKHVDKTHAGEATRPLRPGGDAPQAVAATPRPSAPPPRVSPRGDASPPVAAGSGSGWGQKTCPHCGTQSYSLYAKGKCPSCGYA